MIPFSRLKFYNVERSAIARTHQRPSQPDPQAEAFIFFPNRYGALVSQLIPRDLKDDRYNVLVLRALKPRPKGVLGVDSEVAYDAPIHGLGHMSRDSVEEMLGEIAALPPRGKIDRIEFNGVELDAAEHWHGDMGSMLYAISSTGSLSRGTHRPRNDEGEPMTDDEWLASLARGLAGEAEESAEQAVELAKEMEEQRNDGEDIDEDAFSELLDDEVALRSIARKARRAAEELDPERD